MSSRTMNIGATPTLPVLTNMASRGGLVAVLMLLEAIQGEMLAPETCADWIKDTFQLDVTRIHEGAAGLVVVGAPASAARTARFQQIAEAARQEVVRTLRGLLARPQDDAFVAQTLYEQRVRREARGSHHTWVAHPSPDDTLSTLLLLGFVIDILGNRDSYDSRLSICDDCGRISFVERRTARFGCSQHPVLMITASDHGL